jgi:HSP20 family protein
MAVIRWRGHNFRNPFWELERMRNQMENVYSALASGVNQFRKNYTGVFPLVNLAEDDNNLYISAELPGLSGDSLDLSIKGDTLTIKGSKNVESSKGDVNYHRREREQGSFRRSLTLPVKVEADAVEAVFRNGVLTVTLPKSAEAKARQITVKA